MSVTATPGFTAAGLAAGIKSTGARDLALVATDDGRPVAAAGLFTKNRMCAAPVTVSKGNLRASNGRAAAVVLNSGNANAGTGEPGIEDAELMAALTAAELAVDPHHVLVCSTGLIGDRLPMDVVSSSIPGLVAARSGEGGADAAEAIRTTDTRAKQAVAHGAGFTVGGMGKGAAMLAPDMATMLAVLTTDAAVDGPTLHRVLLEAAEASFHRISIDGSSSTNDTVIILANGRAGPVDEHELRRAVTGVSLDLAEQMCDDAEGATKVVCIHVYGAVDDRDAVTAARHVAESQLVKCSWYGEDPYWGRIASELGASGAHFDPRLVSISYGDIQVAHGGVSVEHDADTLATYLEGRHLDISCDLGLGMGRAWMLTSDLTHAYVDENRGRS